MSVRCISWAFDQIGAGRVKRPSEQVILLAYADQANDDGYFFGGLKIIERLTGRSEKTVRRAGKELERLGLLHRELRRRKNGTRGTYDTWLNIHESDLMAAANHRSSETTGQNDRWSRQEAGESLENGAAAPSQSVESENDHRSNGTTGQNDRWPEMTGRPPVTRDRAVPVKHLTRTNQPTRAGAHVCAREGVEPQEPERFVAFDCGGGQILALDADVIPEYQTTFPELTADQIAQTLREIGAWYRQECLDNPQGRKARAPFEWRRLIRRWLTETLERVKRGEVAATGTGGYSKTAGAVLALERLRRD